MAAMTLIRFYKPFGVMSQFRDPERPALGDFIDVPGVYPAGRLDRDSEGLMLLTDDGALQARIAHPRFKLPKRYWVLVEARPEPAQIDALAARCRQGVDLADGPAYAESLRGVTEPDLPDRDPPVTPHREGRGSWLEVVLTQGRNRQVRRMLAALGLPVLRLHRARIGSVDLSGLAPGAWSEIEVPQELAGTDAPRRRGRTRVRRPKNPPIASR
jgi:23S rRNA pseudouridine2457 synthase